MIINFLIQEPAAGLLQSGAGPFDCHPGQAQRFPAVGRGLSKVRLVSIPCLLHARYGRYRYIGMCTYVGTSTVYRILVQAKSLILTILESYGIIGSELE